MRIEMEIKKPTPIQVNWTRVKTREGVYKSLTYTDTYLINIGAGCVLYAGNNRLEKANENAWKNQVFLVTDLSVSIIIGERD